MTPDYNNKDVRRRLETIESTSSISEEELQKVREKILRHEDLSEHDAAIIERVGGITGGNAELCFLASAGPTGNITIKRLIGVPLQE